MKKISTPVQVKNLFTLLFTITLILVSQKIFSQQDIVFTFNAKDASNTIDSIKATKVETGETAFVEGSNPLNMSSFTTGTNLFSTNAEEISVYPNPFENYTQLIFKSNQNDNIKVSLINAAGQVVVEKSQNINPGIHQFNISTNNNGLYILNITGNQTKFSQKIISTRNNQSLNKIEYNGYSSPASKVKSAKTEEDETIFFFVYSGDNITKIADSPTESKTYEVEFYECKDGDGKNYPIVQIGEQWWMAENLAYDAGEGCWAYDNDENNVAVYGRLYNLEMAKVVCPQGWHLPDIFEWEEMAEFISINNGGYERNPESHIWAFIGNHLKSKIGWNNNGNGIDNYGFSALPGGRRDAETGNFYDFSNKGIWWTATEGSSDKGAYTHILVSEDSNFYPNFNFEQAGLSIRCVKDNLGIIELNDQICPNSGAIMAQISDGIGLVKTSPSTGINYIDYYYEYSDGGSFSAILYPCNISNEQLIVGAEIKFSGLLYSKDDPDDNTIDSDFVQIIISSAEYVE